MMSGLPSLHFSLPILHGYTCLLVLLPPCLHSKQKRKILVSVSYYFYQESKAFTDDLIAHFCLAQDQVTWILLVSGGIGTVLAFYPPQWEAAKEKGWRWELGEPVTESLPHGARQGRESTLPNLIKVHTLFSQVMLTACHVAALCWVQKVMCVPAGLVWEINECQICLEL